MFKLLFFVLFFCIPLCSVLAESTTKELIILYSGDTHGSVIPCDCTPNRDGGLARRSTYISTFKSENKDKNLLLVDAGDVYSGITDSDKINGETILLSMEMMGYSIVNIGDNDVSLGLEYLQDIIKSSGLDFVSANLFKKSGEFLCQPFVIKNIDGIKLGFTGLVTTDFNWQKSGIVVSDPIEKIAEIIPELRKESDIVILLTQLKGDEVRKMINEISGIDIIIMGHSEPSIVTPKSAKKDSSGGYYRITFGSSSDSNNVHLSLSSSDTTESKDSKPASDAIIVGGGKEGLNIGRLIINISSDKKISSFDNTIIQIHGGIKEDPDIIKIIENKIGK
jgi:2',3'-cyclic-nucleotide 2'-phosphodiesterase (5'-nucleotidase family)